MQRAFRGSFFVERRCSNIPQNRDKAGRFVKGKSGNPGGKPRVPETVKSALLAASPDAAQMLIQIMNDQAARPEVRVKCAETILDKVFGKSFQVIADQGNDGHLQEILRAVERLGADG